MSFQEPLSVRIIFLVIAVWNAAVAIWIISLGSRSTEMPVLTMFSITVLSQGAMAAVLISFSILVAVYTLWLSQRHEMHLNFHYRTYNQIVGIGVLRRSQTGSFDEITCVYTRRDVDSRSGNVSYGMGLSFGDTTKSTMNAPYSRPYYGLLGTRDGTALQAYAQDLATKMGRPYVDLN